MRNSSKIFAGFAAAAAAVTLAACAGFPDTGFGTKGVVLLPSTSGPPTSNVSASAVSLPNGKIMAAASGKVFRLNSNGSLDVTYASHGVLNTGSANVKFSADGRAFALDYGGRLSVYTAAGAADRTFSGGSITIANLVSWIGMTVSPAGEIYLNVFPDGIPSTSPDQNVPVRTSLRRYSRTGVLDSTFRFDYVVDVHHFPAAVAGFTADGGILITRSSEGNAADRLLHTYATLQKVTRTGSADANFAKGGSIPLPPDVAINAVVVDQAGDIVTGVNVTVWASQQLVGYRPMLFRFTTRGTADPRFGWLGMAAVPQASKVSNGLSLALDPAGRMVASGSTYGGPLLVYRYLPNGQLDPLFGSNGVVAMYQVNAIAFFLMDHPAVGVDSLGRPLFATPTGNKGTTGNSPVAVVRLRVG